MVTPLLSELKVHVLVAVRWRSGLMSTAQVSQRLPGTSREMSTSLFLILQTEWGHYSPSTSLLLSGGAGAGQEGQCKSLREISTA